MNTFLDLLPPELRQPVGRVSAGFTIGMVTGVAGGFAPILQEAVVEMKVPDAYKRLGLAGIGRQMATGGVGLGTFYGAFQVRSLLWPSRMLCHDVFQLLVFVNTF